MSKHSFTSIVLYTVGVVIINPLRKYSYISTPKHDQQLVSCMTIQYISKIVEIARKKRVLKYKNYVSETQNT